MSHSTQQVILETSLSCCAYQSFAYIKTNNSDTKPCIKKQTNTTSCFHDDLQ